MDKTAKKTLIILSSIIVMGLLGYVLFDSGFNGITIASVSSQTHCVDAKEALNYINEKHCERIYEDNECAEKGLVEVRC